MSAHAMSVQIIPNPNRLAERVMNREDGLTLDQLLERADEITARSVCQWHAGAVHEVMFMASSWPHYGASRFDLAVSVLCFAAMASDMKSNAEHLGYPDIALAASGLAQSLLRIDTDANSGDDGSLRAQLEAVTASLARLRTCLAEPRRAVSNDRDLLAA
jgi:hypothetical protein